MSTGPDSEKKFEQALRAFLQDQRRASEGCPDPAALSAYYERTLDPQEAGAVEEHLAACVDCQAEVGMLARFDTERAPVAPEMGAEESQTEAKPPAERPSMEPIVLLPEAEEPEEPRRQDELDDEDPDTTIAQPFRVPPEVIEASRPRRRWVAPFALAATAVIAISVTYQFSPMIQEATRRALDGAPAIEQAARRALEDSPLLNDREPETTARAEPTVERAPVAPVVPAATALPAAPPPPAAEPQPRDAKEPKAVAEQPSALGAAGGAPSRKDEFAVAAKPQAAEAPKSALKAAAPTAMPTTALQPPTPRPAPTESARRKQAYVDEMARGGDTAAGSARSLAAAAPPAERAAAEAAPAARAAAVEAPPGGVLVPSRASSALIWRCTGTAVERSSDAGKTWQAQQSAPAPLLAGSAPTSEVCWAVGKNGTVIRTTDGRRWQSLSSPTSQDIVQVTAWNDSSARVKSADGSRFSTTDGGITWSKL